MVLFLVAVKSFRLSVKQRDFFFFHDFTGFDLELAKVIDNDQIIMAVLREKKLYITFSICRLTKNKQYKSRLGRILTQTLTFPKFSYAIRPM